MAAALFFALVAIPSFFILLSITGLRYFPSI